MKALEQPRGETLAGMEGRGGCLRRARRREVSRRGCLGQRDDTAAAATVAEELQERGSIEKKVTRGPREKATL